MKYAYTILIIGLLAILTAGVADYCICGTTEGHLCEGYLGGQCVQTTVKPWEEGPYCPLGPGWVDPPSKTDNPYFDECGDEGPPYFESVCCCLEQDIVTTTITSTTSTSTTSTSSTSTSSTSTTTLPCVIEETFITQSCRGLNGTCCSMDRLTVSATVSGDCSGTKLMGVGMGCNPGCNENMFVVTASCENQLCTGVGTLPIGETYSSTVKECSGQNPTELTIYMLTGPTHCDIGTSLTEKTITQSINFGSPNDCSTGCAIECASRNFGGGLCKLPYDEALVAAAGFDLVETQITGMATANEQPIAQKTCVAPKNKNEGLLAITGFHTAGDPNYDMCDENDVCVAEPSCCQGVCSSPLEFIIPYQRVCANGYGWCCQCSIPAEITTSTSLAPTSTLAVTTTTTSSTTSTSSTSTSTTSSSTTTTIIYDPCTGENIGPGTCGLDALSCCCLDQLPDPTCFDEVKNQNEEEVDCGGQCTPCHCNNGILDENEKGVDCGGSCVSCSCSNGQQDAGETEVDCGGICPPCKQKPPKKPDDGGDGGGDSGGGSGGKGPGGGGGMGSVGPSCFDGVKNQDETDVDCGGICNVCITCTDGIQNQGEKGVDCGGPCTACKTNWLTGKTERPDLNIHTPLYGVLDSEITLEVTNDDGVGLLSSLDIKSPSGKTETKWTTDDGKFRMNYTETGIWRFTAKKFGYNAKDKLLTIVSPIIPDILRTTSYLIPLLLIFGGFIYYKRRLSGVVLSQTAALRLLEQDRLRDFKKIFVFERSESMLADSIPSSKLVVITLDELEEVKAEQLASKLKIKLEWAKMLVGAEKMKAKKIILESETELKTYGRIEISDIFSELE